MAYQILSRKWRPQTFDEVIGQGHVTHTLCNAITSNRLAQAYLFSGPRGVGKTTTARILAKALNCSAFPGPTATPCGRCSSCQEIAAGTSVDVLEIDGASNTGVDDIRELREQVKYVPFQGRYKVYIIDEVHMLSNAAFNALLKTLEEPPPHLLFVFATTESHKILPTILSRCQHFHFKRVGRLEMIGQVGRIAAQEGITIGERALSLVAKASEGSVRDALSLIDQVVAYGGAEVREADVVALLGVVDREGFGALTKAMTAKDAGASITALRAMLDHGHDVKLLCADLVEYVRHLTLLKVGGDAVTALDVPKEEIDELQASAASYELDELQRLFAVFSQAQEDLRFAFYPPFTLEMALVQATRVVALEPIQRLIDRLEGRIGPGHGDEKIATAPKVRSAALPPGPAAAPQVIASPTPPPAVDRSQRGAVSPPVAVEAEERWRLTLKRVLDDKPHLGSYLEAGRLTPGGANEIVLEYDAHQVVFGEMASKEENRAYVCRVLRDLFHQEMAFRVISRRETRSVADRPADRRAGASGASASDGAPRRPAVADVVGHPLVKEALDVFGGEVMEVREIPRGRTDPPSRDVHP